MRWKLLNQSHYPNAEVESLLQFVIDRLDLSARLTVKVCDAPPRSQGHYSGRAGDRRRHSMPRWVEGSRFKMLLNIGPEDWEGHVHPHVCWHSKALCELAWSGADVPAHLLDLLSSGETHFGRWPIYWVHSWQEVLVHLAAHEGAHLIQYDRERGAGNSEIFCETFALQTLEAFRAARPCGDQPNPVPLHGGASPSRTPSGSAGLVAGPAPAGSTINRKEPTVAPSTTPTESDPKVAMQGLFESLLDEATKVAEKTQTVEKAAYTRVDVLLGEKHKTLAYVNHPSSKAVRVEIPKKGGGGYDVIKISKPNEIEKAMKAIRANHERIVAAATAA